jgi:hypothetical protein
MPPNLPEEPLVHRTASEFSTDRPGHEGARGAVLIANQRDLRQYQP